MGTVALSSRNGRVFALTFAIAGSIYLIAVFCQPFRIFGKTLLTNYPIAAVAAARFDELSFGGGGFGGGGLGGGVFGGAATTTSVTTALPNGTQTTRIVPVPPDAVTSQTYPLDRIIRYGNGLEQEEYESVINFFTVCHCIWSWHIALCAAWFAGRMYARRLLDSAKPLAV